MQVISNAYLASGTRYLFAAPALSRCLVRLRLERSQRAGPKIFPIKVREYDGIGIEVLHDVGILAANSVGVVRLADA